MAIASELLEILACADCKGKVEYDEEKSEIVCQECGLRYPVRDDIPVMLVEEAVRSDSKSEASD